MNKLFVQMTVDEQCAWWLEQAKQVLKSMDMPDAAVEWLAYTHNAVFVVQCQHEKFVLRMQQQKPNAHLIAEEEMLSFISRSVFKGRVPHPKEIYQSAEIVALLTTFIDGDSVTAETVSDNEMFAIGSFLAELHDMPLSYEGKDKALPHLDWLGLFGKEGIYYPGDANMKVFSDRQLQIINEVTQKVRFAMNAVNQSGMFGLIHGDLLLKNILFHEGEVRALDFEYCGWGYFLYDLTPLLWQLKPQARYPQLEQSLWDGYSKGRPWNDEDLHRELLETFIAGRQVASMRWIAANQRNPHVIGKVDAILEQRTAELSAFLDTGELKRE